MQACSSSTVVPLWADSGTSIQHGFASDVLVSIAVRMFRLLLHLNQMCGSASCIATCLYLQSETHTLIIVLMGQAGSGLIHTYYM